MKLRSLLLTVTIIVTLAPLPAHATGCGKWNRMSDARKSDLIDQMINDAISGQKGRSYRFNRNAIGRCLANHSEDMFWDFNDLCSDASTAGMRAIQGRFKDYIWTCVN